MQRSFVLKSVVSQREFGKKIMDLCLNSNPHTEWEKVVDWGRCKWKGSGVQATISKPSWGATI